MLRSLLLGLAAGICVLAACVGDDPQTNTPITSIDAGFGGTSGTQGTSSGGASGMDGGNSEGGTTLTCDALQTACNNTCVDLHTSKTNCGRCGRACGPGSDCSSSACAAVQSVPTLQDIYALAATDTGVVVAYTPEQNKSSVIVCKKEEGCGATTFDTIKSGIENAVTMTAAGTSVYFNDAPGGDNSFIFGCSVNGCPAAGPIQIEHVVNDPPGVIAAGPNRVVWSRSNGTFNYFNSCGLPDGCSATNVTITPVKTVNPNAPEGIKPTNQMSVGAKSVLWNTGGTVDSNTKFLAFCSLASACDKGTLLDTGGASPTAMFHANGMHFVSTAKEQRGDIIYAFHDDDPSKADPIANDQQGIVSIAADATGVYWANGKSGEILRCGNLKDGCTTNEKLAVGQTGVKFIAINNKYVFWATTTKVFQVAK